MAGQANELRFRLKVDGEELRVGLDQAIQHIKKFEEQAGGATRAIKKLSDEQKFAAQQFGKGVAKDLGLPWAEVKRPMMTAYSAGMNSPGGDESQARSMMQAMADHYRKAAEENRKALQSVRERVAAEQQGLEIAQRSAATQAEASRRRMTDEEQIARLQERNQNFLSGERTARLTSTMQAELRMLERMGRTSDAEARRAVFTRAMLERQAAASSERDAEQRRTEEARNRERELERLRRISDRARATADRERHQETMRQLRDEGRAREQSMSAMMSRMQALAIMAPGGGGPLAGLFMGAGRMGPLGLLGMTGTAAAAGGFMIGDQYNQLLQRMETAMPGGSKSGAAAALSAMTNIAVDLGVALGDVVPLYQQLVLTGKDLGISNQEAEKLTRNILNLAATSGISAQAMQFGLRQMGQALGMGVVHAEEFNSMVENMYPLVVKIAEAMGKTVAQLRQDVIQQKVSSRDLLNGLQEIQVASEGAYISAERTLTRIWEFSKAKADDFLGLRGWTEDVLKNLNGIINGLEKPLSLKPIEEQIAAMERDKAKIDALSSFSGGVYDAAHSPSTFPVVGPLASLLTRWAMSSEVGTETGMSREQIVKQLAALKDTQKKNAELETTPDAFLKPAQAFMTHLATQYGALKGLPEAATRLSTLDELKRASGASIDPKLSADIEALHKFAQAYSVAADKVGRDTAFFLNSEQDPKQRKAIRDSGDAEQRRLFFDFIAEANKKQVVIDKNVAEKLGALANVEQTKAKNKLELDTEDQRVQVESLRLQAKQIENEATLTREREKKLRLIDTAASLEAQAAEKEFMIKFMNNKELSEGDEKRAKAQAAAHAANVAASVKERLMHQVAIKDQQEAHKKEEETRRAQERYDQHFITMKEQVSALEADITAEGLPTKHEQALEKQRAAIRAIVKDKKDLVLRDEEMAALAEKIVSLEEKRDAIIKAREMNAKYDPEARYKQRMEELARWKASGGLSDEAYRREMFDADLDRLSGSKNWVDGMKAGAMEYSRTMESTAEMTKKAFLDSFKAMEDGLTDFVMTGKLNTTSFANHILSEMARAAVKKTITEPLSGILQSALGSGFLGLFGGWGGGGGGTVGGGVKGMPAEPPVLSALGNAFHNGNVLPFAIGGVVGGPTLAPMALMGEAGPEAVMPLARRTDGKLGVLGAGGGGANVVVNVIASPGKGGQVNERIDNGTRFIDVMVEQVESAMSRRLMSGRSNLGTAIENTYGARRGGY